MSVPFFDRRSLIKHGAGLALLGAASPARLLAAPAFRHYPFTLGVAAGDPAPDGFVLWTRLAPEPQAADGGMPPHDVAVRWEVAEDAAFRRIVRSGSAIARAGLAHSVHVEVDGLRPHRPHWYRFLVPGADASPVGCARTAPAAGAPVDRLRVAMAGCQNFEMGYFTAYAHLARESDLDAVFHYGDYIYELGPGATPGPRTHVGEELSSLADYRRRLREGQPFLLQVLQQPKLFVIGDETLLHALALPDSSLQANDMPSVF